VKSPTLAFEGESGNRTPLTLPVGSIVHVIDGPKPDTPLIHAVWGKKWILVYQQDLVERSEEAD
jgi:hypothetical protein